MLEFLLENWQSIAGYLLGGGGLGFLFIKQDKQAKIIANISSATDEWKKFVDELKLQVQEEREEKKEAREEKKKLQLEKEELYERLNKSLENDANAAYYKGLYHASRCDIWTCPNRRPPLNTPQEQDAKE